MGLGGAGGRRGEGRRAAAMASNGSGKPTNGSKCVLQLSFPGYLADDVQSQVWVGKGGICIFLCVR